MIRNVLFGAGSASSSGGSGGGSGSITEGSINNCLLGLITNISVGSFVSATPSVVIDDSLIVSSARWLLVAHYFTLSLCSRRRTELIERHLVTANVPLTL